MANGESYPLLASDAWDDRGKARSARALVARHRLTIRYPPFFMVIREYTPADLDALRRMHAAQGFGYSFPDLDNPLFLVELVLEDDDDSSSSGNAAMAILLRLTAEAYLLHDPAAGTPRRRWQNLLALHEAVQSAARARGLDDVQAFLPPPVARSFGRRLERLGWRRDPWTCFSRQLRG